VSVVIPTRDRIELLTQRALPSVLGQSYANLEVLVVGHGAPPAVGEAVAANGDARVRYLDVPRPLLEPTERRQWLVGSVAPRRAGVEHASGAWLVDMDDDDALRPYAIERVLAHARRERLEVCAGAFEQHGPDGSLGVVPSIPGELGSFAWQGAVMHAGLRFFERSGVAAIFDVPNDHFRTEAMLRAGVRFGALDDVVVDYYPSQLR